jgi:hypothetical protein
MATTWKPGLGMVQELQTRSINISGHGGPSYNLVTGYSGNKLYRPCFCTQPLPRKGSSDNPWAPGTRIFWLNGNDTWRRKTECTILKAVVGAFSLKFRHRYNDSALFVFSVRNRSPLLLRLMVFWLQSLGPGMVSGSRVSPPLTWGYPATGNDSMLYP